MRTSDMQFAEAMRRSEGVKERRAAVRKIAASAIVSALLIALIIGASFTVPMLNETRTEAGEQHLGSMYLVTPYLGYVIIGMLAFALGICATLLCVYIKKLKRNTL